MQDDEFEWDDAKNESNWLKHGITFEMAREVFRDVFAVISDENSEIYFEDRFQIIGVSDNHLLYVFYTIRNNRIRIISARLAKPSEKRRFYNANQT